MLSKLSAAVVKLIKSAAKGLTLQKRRAFQATVAEQFCDGSSRKAANEVRDAILGSSLGARRIDTALDRDDTAAVDTLDVTVNDKSSPLQPTKVLVRSACKHYPW